MHSSPTHTVVHTSEWQACDETPYGISTPANTGEDHGRQEIASRSFLLPRDEPSQVGPAMGLPLSLQAVTAAMQSSHKLLMTSRG